MCSLLFRYYTATANQDSAQRHVYKITDDGKGTATCLSCANGCQYASADFSHKASYYVLSCNGPSPPSSDLYAYNKVRQSCNSFAFAIIFFIISVAFTYLRLLSLKKNFYLKKLENLLLKVTQSIIKYIDFFYLSRWV